MEPDSLPLSPLRLSPRMSLERFALIVILVSFIVAGVIYSVSTPFLDVSDEVRHYAMIEHLAQGNGLPVQNPAQHGFYEQEGSQPPLYYALMALVALPFDRSDFMALAQFNPHARLGRADTTSNWNQLIHTDAEHNPWHGTVLVVRIIRFLGILMGAMTVLCTYLIAKELLAGRRREAVSAPFRPSSIVPLLAASFTAFSPMFVFISASVNNDNLAAMLASLALLLGVRIVCRGLTWRRAIMLGVILGCAAISKASALALVIVIPPAVLLAEWLRQSERQASLGTRLKHLRIPVAMLALSLALICGIAGWWYVRNASLYHGDFTGTTMMATIAGARETLPSVGELISEWDGFRKAYWGLFGAVNIPMDLWIYSAFDVVLILAGIGLLLLVKDLIKALQSRTVPPTPEWDRLIAALMCFGVFSVAFAALIRWTSITLASQGRLLFPVIAIISTFIAWGLGRLAIWDLGFGIWDAARAPAIGFAIQSKLETRRIRSHPLIFAPYALPVALALLTLASPFLYIRPAYAIPPQLRDGQTFPLDIPCNDLRDQGLLPSNMTCTELRFEDAIRWIGYRVETERVQPGQEFVVTLYWQGLRPMDTNYSAGIRLYGRSDTEVFLLDSYPGGGMWQTTRWLPGTIIADRYRLRVEDTLTTTRLLPSALWLDIGFWNFQTKQFLQTFDGSGNPTGRQRYEAGALALPGDPTSSSDHSPARPYLSQAQPAQVRIDQQSGQLTMTIVWAVTADFNEDYTVFVHLFDSAGEKVAQADGRAVNDTFSTRWWRKGDRVEDPHTFDLPPDLPAGNYTIRYGLYRPGDGARMPAFDAQGQAIPDATLTELVTIR
ncbi:MAG: glycosyltransferase family 39 protein [Chloroflexi bacterium]|nr:glycosyltransferase family 39 protein [Chloroflexota bacterium]